MPPNATKDSINTPAIRIEITRRILQLLPAELTEIVFIGIYNAAVGAALFAFAFKRVYRWDNGGINAFDFGGGL